MTCPAAGTSTDQVRVACTMALVQAVPAQQHVYQAIPLLPRLDPQFNHIMALDVIVEVPTFSSSATCLHWLSHASLLACRWPIRCLRWQGVRQGAGPDEGASSAALMMAPQRPQPAIQHAPRIPTLTPPPHPSSGSAQPCSPEACCRTTGRLRCA